jgi:ADP-heptose:LPS heptosyltransferase
VRNALMTKVKLFKFLFEQSSNITDHFPEKGSRFLDFLVFNSLGNRFLKKYFDKRNQSNIKKIKRFQKFLVVADLNIGDSVIAWNGIYALKEIFPDSKIDYVVKKSTQNIIKGYPEVNRIYSVYNGSPFPGKDDLYALKQIVKGNKYDVILNFSPMINKKIFGSEFVIDYSIMANELLNNESKYESVNNITYQAYRFVRNIFRDYCSINQSTDFRGSRIYLSNKAVIDAQNFLIKKGLDLSSPKIMINPDASSIFTRIPFNLQLQLLKTLSELDCQILLGSGHVEKFIERRLISALTKSEREKVIIIPPSVELDVYAALIDFSDVFITGDTGPLHLAAARKYLQEDLKALRNQTAVFSIFGSTPPRIYGYDSQKQGFFPANQDALSRVFIAKSQCRNITCINKVSKTCAQVRCFQDLNPDEIIESVKEQIMQPEHEFYNLNRTLILNENIYGKSIG